MSHTYTTTTASTDAPSTESFEEQQALLRGISVTTEEIAKNLDNCSRMINDYLKGGNL